MSVLSYSKLSSVNVHDVDFAGRLKISAILRYFQNLATAHAEQLGVGFASMQARELVWVLNRVCAEIVAQPQPEEQLNTVTFPLKPNAVDAVRDYYLYGADGRLLVKGTSKWCVLDAKTHAIRRVAPLFDFPPEAYMQQSAIAGGCATIQKTDAAIAYASTVRVTDLDRNSHVNNARYGDMILDACSKEWMENHAVVNFSVHYMSELQCGNEYAVCCTPDKRYFEGRSGNTEIFRASVGWREYGV